MIEFWLAISVTGSIVVLVSFGYWLRGARDRAEGRTARAWREAHETLHWEHEKQKQVWEQREQG